MIPTIGYTFPRARGRMEVMKSKKLEYGSKGVMRAPGVVESWSNEVGADGEKF